MPRFPVDAPKTKVLRALAKLGFQIVRERSILPLSEKTLMARVPR